jgi:SAM-dependent methyltransferase
MKKKGNLDGKWISAERSYWDRFYFSKQNSHHKISPGLVAGNRLYPRDKYLFSFLRPIIKDKKLLELGCGDVETIKQLADPVKYKYSYTGIDISLEALKIARQKIKGDFFLESIENHPFKDSSFDIILCLGVLHHTKGKEKLLIKLSKLLKKNGIILLEEPLERPGLLGKIFRRLLFFIPESEYEERINEKKLLRQAEKVGRIIFQKKGYSPTRTLLVLFLDSLMKKSSFITKIVFFFDRLTIKTLGRFIPVLNGGEIFLIIKK